MYYCAIDYSNIFSLDDCDQNKLLKISKTLWQDTASTNVNITNKHGVRAGARAVTIGISGKLLSAFLFLGFLVLV